jgi:hypothetical protein
MTGIRLALFLLLAASPAFAQGTGGPYRLDGTIGQSAGGPLSGGIYSLAGSVSPVAGVPLSGGTFAVTGGPLAQSPDVVELLGDVDGDQDVDQGDLEVVLAARNSPATGPDDPRDLDGDGVITALDARKLILLCTRPRCEGEPGSAALSPLAEGLILAVLGPAPEPIPTLPPAGLFGLGSAFALCAYVFGMRRRSRTGR